MIAVKIEKRKEFMQAFLSADRFDELYVMNAEIRTLITTKINGLIQNGWLSEEEKKELDDAEFAKWKQIRPIVYDLVKGKKIPSAVIVNLMKIFENGDKGILRVQYINGELEVITAYQTVEFTLNKEAEFEWDEYCAKWLSAFDNGA
ncbi:MAG: DUF5721 family protein [Lachnoclostridium sp.]|jgi:hypothetical protein|nr:DUF5721 family protein [Lachnoclostridium sp.]